MKNKHVAIKDTCIHTVIIYMYVYFYGEIHIDSETPEIKRACEVFPPCVLCRDVSDGGGSPWRPDTAGGADSR